MSAVLGAGALDFSDLPKNAADADTDADLARWLPADGAPWSLSFELWTQAEAQRWRVVVAVSGKVPARSATVLLADRPADTLLRERIESRLQRSVRWIVCSPQAIDSWLGEGAAGFRALAVLGDSFTAAAETDQAAELSALHLSEQSSPVVRLLDSTLYDALQDGASDVHLESPRAACACATASMA